MTAQSTLEPPKIGRTRRVLRTLTIGTLAFVGWCNIQGRRFEAKELPCETPNLPDVAGAKPLTEHICIAVSGEQPQKLGIETSDLPEGRKRNTLFLEWNYDGATEHIRLHKPDAEPITLITDNKGTPLEIQVRSHWRIGKFKFDECQKEGKVKIAITNSFHTPIVAGCEPTVVNPNQQGEANRVAYTFVFNTIYFYGRACGQDFIHTFQPLEYYPKNEIPGPDHKCREQPIFDGK